MLAWVFWLLVALGPDDELVRLAEAGAWDELIHRAASQVEADPADGAARYWLGRARLERALELLAGGDRFSRDLARALLERAQESLVAVEPQTAAGTEDARDWYWVARFESVLAREDADTEALARELEQEWAQGGRGLVASLRGALTIETAEAVTWFGRAVEADPERADFLLDWADVLSAAGQGDEALAAWRRARDAGGDLDGLLSVLVAILPARADAERRLAELDGLLSRGDAAGHARLAWHRAYALGQLARLDEAAQAFAAGPRGLDVDYDRAHAAMLQRVGRHGAAADLLTPWIERRHWDAYDDLVGLADELGLARSWDESLALYERALALEDRDERARRNHALTLYRAGRAAMARQAWEQLVELFPGRADILNDAALAAWGSGEAARARSLLERAAELPGSEDARENLAAWLLRNEDGAGTEARRWLDAVLAVEPDRDRALYLRLLARDPS